MSWKVVLAFLVIFGTVASSSPPCADITHSECRDDPHPFDEINMPNKEACQIVCTAYGEDCHFVVFDNKPFARANCRLYNADFSKYILHCNELAGPKTSDEGCDLLNPIENSCQVYRSGQCAFGETQETQLHSSWELCQAACKSTTECQFWRFEKEEKLCLILYSVERKCTWEFLPREPFFGECDDNPTNCDIPEPQKHGDWFCPPSTDPATCHLECHPGYVSDNGTVITCNHGEWSSAPTCVAAVALITGSYRSIPSNTVEIYAEGLHKKLPNLPDNRHGHTLQLVDSTILLCGGVDTTTSCLILTSTQEWTSHSTTTSSRYYYSSVSMLGQLHLLGSYSSTTTTEQLTPPSTEWIPAWDLLEATSYACSAKIGPEMFIVTGGNTNKGSAVSYNVTNGAATRLQDLITPRRSHGCVYVMNVDTKFRGILVAGGDSGGSTSEMYDLTSGMWSRTGDLTSQRIQGVRMVVLGDNILAMGGEDGFVLSTVDKFNLTSMEWKSTEDMLEPRRYHTVTGVPPSAVCVDKQ